MGGFSEKHYYNMHSLKLFVHIQLRTKLQQSVALLQIRWMPNRIRNLIKERERERVAPQAANYPKDIFNIRSHTRCIYATMHVSRSFEIYTVFKKKRYYLYLPL